MQRRTKGSKGPLLVKEIILPVKPFHSPGTDLQKVENVTGGRVSRTIDNHEGKPGLFILKKMPHEHYFDGTKPKKRTRRRTKTRINHSLSQFYDSQSDTKTPTESSPTLQDLIKKSKCQQQVQQYEKMKRYCDWQNQIKQRKAEKAYIQQQEYLVETWLKCLKKTKTGITISVLSHNNEDLPPDMKDVDKGLSDLVLIED